MNNPARLVSEVAGEVVRDISEPYEDYHAHLVGTFTRVLGVLQVEPNQRSQRREIAGLVTEFAGQVSSKLGEV